MLQSSNNIINKFKLLMERELHFNAIKRKFGLTSMQKIIRVLRRRNIEINKLQALEVFGGRGYFHCIDYASHVSKLEVWEINPENEKYLRFNLPKALIKITNSYDEIKIAKKKYDLIVVDNSLIPENGYYEHFGIFPDIFRIANNFCIIILAITPNLNDQTITLYSYRLDDKHAELRKSFYKANDPKNIPIDKMIMTYKQHCKTNYYGMEWFFVIQRNISYHYLVFGMRKII